MHLAGNLGSIEKSLESGVPRYERHGSSGGLGPAAQQVSVDWDFCRGKYGLAVGEGEIQWLTRVRDGTNWA